MTIIKYQMQADAMLICAKDEGKRCDIHDRQIASNGALI